MRGSEQGDYSRVLFEPRKHYSTVRMQQGRVLLDSDWNAEMDLLAERLRTETRDTVGLAGGPASDAGFGIEAEAVLAFEGGQQWMTLDLTGLGPERRSGLTFETRLNVPTAGTAGTLLTILGRRDGGPAVELALELDAEGRLRLQRVGAGGALISSTRISYGHFNRVALTLSEGEAALYLEGELAAKGPPGFLSPASSFVVVVGAPVGVADGRGFEGLLLDLCLWSRCRDATELRPDRRHAPSPDAPGLLGYWRFSRPGATVDDEAGSGRRWQLGGGDPTRAPSWILRELTVGRGRYYVGGLLCQNEERVPFSAQPDAPGRRLPHLDERHLYLFYLDAWELTVTAVQDPDLREVALADADTTVRARTIAQVNVLPLPLTDASITEGRDAAHVWRRFLELEAQSGLLRARRSPSAQELGNLLYRVEIHSGGGLYGWPRALGPNELILEGEALDGRRLRLTDTAALQSTLPRSTWQSGDTVEIWNSASDSAGKAGMTAVVSSVDLDSGILELDPQSFPSGGRLPDGLLRARRVATYKWSRQNAAQVYPLASVEPGGSVVTLADPGRRELDLEPGDWLEYLDDVTLLAQTPRPLCRIKSLDPALLQLTLSRPPVPAGGEVNEHPALRLWNQKSTADPQAASNGVSLARAGWLPIECGIEISFAGDGPYRAGDYWWMPARTRDASIAWPQITENSSESGTLVPAACPPRGIGHAYAPLAVLTLPGTGMSIADCRKTFHPLSDGAVSKAGDSMYGPLVVRSHVVVEGGGPDDPGSLTAEVLYGPLGSPGSVRTSNLARGAVTVEKLAPDAGIVPPGFSILGASPEPPPGYRWSGSAIAVFQPFAPWRTRAPLPRTDPGPLRGAAVGGRLYVALESGELFEYDPGEDRWHARCRRPGNLQSFAVAGTERLFVIGGFDARLGKSGATLIYDPASDRWTAGQDMPTPRSHLSLATLGGKLYALGGIERSWLGDRVSRANEEYDPAADLWQRRASMPDRLYDCGAGGAGSVVHAFGGQARPWFGWWGNRMPLDHHEYTPASNRWLRRGAKLAYPCAHPGTQEIEGHLFVLGGEGALGPLESVLELESAHGLWRDRPPLAAPASWVAAGAVHGSLFAASTPSTSTAPPLAELGVATRYFIHRKD